MKKYRTFSQQAAQGDILITKIGTLPENKIELPHSGDKIIVTHSETGHHHVIEKEKAIMYQSTQNKLISYLSVQEPAYLEHLRSYDTHDAILLEPGNYEVRKQREYDLEDRFRAVKD